MDADGNPRISIVLRAVTWLEVVILLWAGGGLLFYPPAVQGVWPWSLAPFNLRYLGALYLAALVAALLQAWSGRWSPARVVTTMIFVFTLVVTVLSFVHLARFDLHRVEAWIWFVLYIGVCANAGVHLWLYRRWPSVDSERPRGMLRGVLACVTVGLGAYGLALLAAPDAASAFWPWKLDPFHAQLYSVTFLTPAAGAWLLSRRATSAERVALGLTLAAWGVLPILGLVLVDLAVKRVQWASAGTWIWSALFAAMFLAGAWIASRRGSAV
jgi:hypothetical protein